MAQQHQETARHRHYAVTGWEQLAPAFPFSRSWARDLTGRILHVSTRVTLSLLCAAGPQVQDMSAELGVGCQATVDLYCSQPGIWAVSQPSIIKDRCARAG